MHTTPCAQCSSPLSHPPRDLGLLRADVQCANCGVVQTLDLSENALHVATSPNPSPPQTAHETLLGDLERAEVMHNWESFQPDLNERPEKLFGPVGTDLSKDLSHLNAPSSPNSAPMTSVTDTNVGDLLQRPSDGLDQHRPIAQFDDAAKRALLGALESPSNAAASIPSSTLRHATPSSTYSRDALELAPIAPKVSAPAPAPDAYHNRGAGRLSNGRTSRAYRRDGTMLGRALTWSVALAVMLCFFALLYGSFVFLANLTGHSEYTTLGDDLIPAYEKHTSKGLQGAGKTLDAIKARAERSINEIADASKPLGSKGRIRGRYIERIEVQPDGSKVIVMVPRDEEGDPLTEAKKRAHQAKNRTQAPRFSFPRAKGSGSVTNASVKGQKTVLNFYATWCKPCRREAPQFSVFAKNQAKRSNPVQVFGIALQSGTAQQVIKKSRAFGVEYPILMGQQATARAFGVRALPTTVILDEEGRIIKKVTGEMNAAQLAQFTDQD